MPDRRTSRPSGSRRWRGAGARRGGRTESGHPAGSGRPGARRGPRSIGEELLQEARRLYRLALSLRAVAETLLEQTSYASANSADVALRFQFKRRGWPLRTRAQARRARRVPERDDLARAA
jgi:hypothetical protein